MTVRQNLLPFDDTGDMGPTMSMQMNCIGPCGVVKVPNCVSARSLNRFGDTGILPAGDQIRDTLERDPRVSSHLASHW